MQKKTPRSVSPKNVSIIVAVVILLIIWGTIFYYLKVSWQKNNNIALENNAEVENLVFLDEIDLNENQVRQIMENKQGLENYEVVSKKIEQNWLALTYALPNNATTPQVLVLFKYDPEQILKEMYRSEKPPLCGWLETEKVPSGLITHCIDFNGELITESTASTAAQEN